MKLVTPEPTPNPKSPFWINALAALELSKKFVIVPPSLVIAKRFPAVDVSKKLITAGPLPTLRFWITPLPAVELLKKLMVPLSLWINALPAVELFKKLMVPLSFRIVCGSVELFTMPTPTKEKELPSVLIVKALAPRLNVMESMVTSPERDSEVIVEVLNVAVSPAMTGGIAGVQLPPVFQSPDNGQQFQTASTASAGAAMATNSRKAPRAVAKNP